jgi:Ribonuclease G/E
MSPDRILAMRGPGETRAALLAGEELLEIVHLRDAEAQPGAVHAVRVGEKHPGASFFFVDLGFGAPGLIDHKGDPPPEGKLIAAVVSSPAHGDKGPKLKLSKAAIPEALTTPGLITPAPDVVREWWRRYGETIEMISATPRAEARRITELLGSDAPVESAMEGWALFDAVDEQIEVGLSKTVKLPGGGRLIIEHTSALTAVDIDGGASSIAAANEQAMVMLARQLRLRNIAGHVVVDLIPHPNRKKFLRLLKDACAADPVETQVRGFTPSGMIDVVRRRNRASLAETLSGKAGGLNVRAAAYRALRTACREMTSRRMASVDMTLAADVARTLNEGLKAALDEAQSMASGRITITAEPAFANDRVEIAAV